MLQATVQLYRNAYSGLSRPIWWLALVMLINRSGTMVIPFLTVYLTQKGFTIQEAGYVMGAFGVGSIVGGYLGGRLTDRFGHFYVQAGSLMLNGLLFILLGQMQTFAQITITIFVLSSLGEAFRPANSAAIAIYSTSENRTRCYSLNRLAVNLGWAIGPAVGGLLASSSYSLLFWADGLTCLFASFLLYVVFRPKGKTETPKPKAHGMVLGRSAYRDRIFLWGMLLVFIVGVCFFQMFSILPVFYRDHLNLDEDTIGLLLSLNGLVIALFEMVLVYKLEGRRHVASYMVLGAFCIGLSFIMLNTAPLLAVALAAILVVTVGEMLLFPFMNNFWVNRSTESNRGQYAAMYTMAFSAAIVLAPTLAAQLAAAAGFSTLWLADFAICSAAALGFYLLKKKMNKDEQLQPRHTDPVV